MKVDDDDAQSKVTLALKFRIKVASDLGIFQVAIFFDSIPLQFGNNCQVMVFYLRTANVDTGGIAWRR